MIRVKNREKYFSHPPVNPDMDAKYHKLSNE